jgi:hypothetical protein
MVKTVTQLRDEWADRESIRDCLYRYARAVDRVDMELMKTVYWPGAMDYHTGFSGTAEEFMAWASTQLGTMGINTHLFGNILIDMDEARTTARVESYHIFVIAGAEGGGGDTIGSGRYLDRFEKRDDDWRIAERTVLVDWWKDLPGTVDWKTGPFGMGHVPRGLPGREDPSYGHFGA